MQDVSAQESCQLLIHRVDNHTLTHNMPITYSHTLMTRYHNLYLGMLTFTLYHTGFVLIICMKQHKWHKSYKLITEHTYTQLRISLMKHMPTL